MIGITAQGYYLGRKKDHEDTRDHLFKMAHAHAMLSAVPSRYSLRDKMPAVYDQLDMQACGANCGDAVLAVLYPEMKDKGFSRLQLYYGARAIEDTVNEDTGVETRDLFRVMQLTGVAPESLWPYAKSNLMAAPPQAIYDAAEEYTIDSFSRLEAEAEYLTCLSQGFPIILGIELFESIDSPDLARTGVMPMPDPAREQVVGGHDLTIIGFDLDFKNSKVFKDSGVDPALVTDHALEIRNSWGASWGNSGHMWIPMKYATDAALGNDSWTARV